jgi:tetratricopeptide (TPR) repeat protein
VLPIAKQFDLLSREQILAIRPGTWGDFELLDVLKYFETERKDRDRAMAVAELILRSPQVSDVDYDWLCLDLMGYYRWKRDWPAALRWAHFLIAYDEQHDEGSNRASHCRDLAETYLEAGDLDTGLALFTRLAQATPHDIWTYNALAFALPGAGLPHLALQILDHALALVTQNDPEQLKVQLTEQRHRIVEALTSTPDRSSDLSPAVWSHFCAALLAPLSDRSVRSTAQEATPYLPTIVQLLAAGAASDAVVQTAALRGTQAKVLIPELIRLAFDPALPVDGAPARAVELLRALRDAQAAELGELSPWLDRATGDWRNELLTPHCGKVGGYTTPELEAIAADGQYSVYIRSSATQSLVERAERQPTQRERIIAFMRTLLTRPEADTAGEETLVGFLIGDVLDLDARELYPEIQRAFAEDRVDTSVITLPDVHGRWRLAPVPVPERRKDGLYLRLRCTACDRIREHFVQNVLLDLGTLEQQTQGRPVVYDPYIMDHEIVCPKCGAVDQYAMTPQAHLALLVLPNKVDDLTALLAGKKSASDLPPNPRVHPFRSSVFKQPMHPLAGLEEYRRRIAANPKDAKLYMRMGTLLRTLYRYSDALEAHRQAYALNPNDAEIALARAMSEHDFGDRVAAKEMYERVLALELKGKGRWGIVRSDTWAGAAMEGLEELKRHKPSPWALPAYDPVTGKRTEATVASPTVPSQKRQFSPAHPKQLNRNDPCWCGSGKKYKYCHMKTDQSE